MTEYFWVWAKVAIHIGIAHDLCYGSWSALKSIDCKDVERSLFVDYRAVFLIDTDNSHRLHFELEPTCARLELNLTFRVLYTITEPV